MTAPFLDLASLALVAAAVAAVAYLDNYRRIRTWRLTPLTDNELNGDPK